MNKQVIDKTFRKYRNLTNMNYEELLKWSKNPKTKEASVKPSKESIEAKTERRKLKVLAKVYKIPLRDGLSTALIRNLVLKKIKSKEWDEFLVSQANKAISYLSRAKKIKGEWNVNIIALKNWAFNPDK